MAHEIFDERILLRDKPGWHHLGRIFTGHMMPSDAIAEICKDLTIFARPVTVTLEDGTDLPTGQKAIIRKPLGSDTKHRIFGVVDENWRHIDYAALAQRLDALYTSEYKVETAGLLKDGALCFISFRGPDFDVAGDQMQDNYLINLSNLPGMAHTASASKIRTVCWNTNTEALESASIKLSIPHTDKAEDRLAFAADLVMKFRAMTAKSKEIFEKFAKVQITEQNLNLLLEAAWPTPAMPNEVSMLVRASGTSDETLVAEAFGGRLQQVVDAKQDWIRSTKRVEALREAGRESFEKFDPAHLRGSVWAAYNAVTEVADWRSSFGSDVGVSILFGNRAKEKKRAYSAALQLVK